MLKLLKDLRIRILDAEKKYMGGGPAMFQPSLVGSVPNPLSLEGRGRGSVVTARCWQRWVAREALSEAAQTFPKRGFLAGV